VSYPDASLSSSFRWSCESSGSGTWRYKLTVNAWLTGAPSGSHATLSQGRSSTSMDGDGSTTYTGSLIVTTSDPTFQGLYYSATVTVADGHVVSASSYVPNQCF
jgi:hypothetical protein